MLFGILFLLPRSENYEANNYMAAIIDKHERVNALKGNQKIFVAGGSNVAFGVNSKMIQNELDIPTINMGLHIGLGVNFILEELKRKIEPNDIAILSFEYFMHVDGHKDLLEHTHELYPEVKNYTKKNTFINKFYYQYNKTKQKCLAYFVKSNKKKKGRNFAAKYSREMFNSQGDFIHETLNYSREGTLQVKTNNSRYKEWEGIDLLNNFNDYAKSKNITVFYLFPPLHEDAYNAQINNISKLAKDIEDNLNFPILNKSTDCIYPDNMFLDTKYHLTSDGSNERTKGMIEGLKKVLDITEATKTQTTQINSQEELVSQLSNKTTKGGIKLINGKKMIDQQMPILMPKEGLSLNGFAIDKINKRLATKIFFVIGEEEIPSKSYGIPKKAIGKTMGQQYLKSGFNENIPKARFPKGEHSIYLKVVTYRNTYYLIDTGVTILN